MDLPDQIPLPFTTLDLTPGWAESLELQACGATPPRPLPHRPAPALWPGNTLSEAHRDFHGEGQLDLYSGRKRRALLVCR